MTEIENEKATSYEYDEFLDNQIRKVAADLDESKTEAASS